MISNLVRTILSSYLIFAFTSAAISQVPSPIRKFQTTYEIDMYAEPEVGAKRLGSVPAGVILEALQETERYGGYVKVAYKKKTGFIFKAEVQRYMDVPASELACWSNGYKIIGTVYRYYFVLRNDGTLAYKGNITIRLFDGNDKMIFEKTADYSDGIKPETGGQFLIDTAVEATQFELEHKDGKIKGSSGKFIERL
jgi:hypothetical protein